MRSWKITIWMVAAIALALGLTMTLLPGVQPAGAALEGYGVCMQDMCSVPDAWTCTAQDVQITNLKTVGVTEYCDGAGDTGTYTFQMELTPQAQDRYDVAVWLAVDGGSGATGSCYSTYLPPPLDITYLPLPPEPVYGPPFWDLEDDKDTGDQCGDVRASQKTYYEFEVTIACTDDNSDGQVDDIGSCLGWDQDLTIDCPANGACPDTGSECLCGDVAIEVVTYPIDLSVVKTVSADAIAPNQVFTYTIVVSNDDATLMSTGFTITDDLPEYLHYVSYSGDYFTCEAVEDVPAEVGGEVVTCVVTQDLAAGASYSVDLRVQFKGDAYPMDIYLPSDPWIVALDNEACVTGFERDLVETNNCDGVSVATAVELKSFTAAWDKGSVALRWETTSETDNLGFNIYRSKTIDGKRKKLNEGLIPTLVYPGSLEGAVYRFSDNSAKPNVIYYYWLEDVDVYGRTTLHGPVEVLGMWMRNFKVDVPNALKKLLRGPVDLRWRSR